MVGLKLLFGSYPGLGFRVLHPWRVQVTTAWKMTVSGNKKV
jgi:hypothetical protein